MTLLSLTENSTIAYSYTERWKCFGAKTRLHRSYFTNSVTAHIENCLNTIASCCPWLDIWHGIYPHGLLWRQPMW